MTPKVVLHFENVLFIISSIAMFLVFIPSFFDGLYRMESFKLKGSYANTYQQI